MVAGATRLPVADSPPAKLQLSHTPTANAHVVATRLTCPNSEFKRLHCQTTLKRSIEQRKSNAVDLETTTIPVLEWSRVRRRRCVVLDRTGAPKKFRAASVLCDPSQSLRCAKGVIHLARIIGEVDHGRGAAWSKSLSRRIATFDRCSRATPSLADLAAGLIAMALAGSISIA